jgi:outer membrane protein assembly factor BamB
MLHRIVAATTVLCFLIACPKAIAGETPGERPGGSDWAAFGGPRGDGSSPETGLLRKWEAGGPRTLWRADIKQGWGSPAVAGDDVCLGWSETPRGDRETIVCFSAADGREKWRYAYDVGAYWERNIGWPRGGFRTMPLITDRHVFAIGALGHLHCLDRKTGHVVWKTNLWEEFNPSGEKGYCFSPILAGGTLVLWYSDGAAAVKDPEHRMVLCRGLRPQTGEVLWTFSEPHREPARTGEGQTPSVATFGGEPCVLVTANCQLKAIRAADGKQVWAFDCINPQARGTTIPTPLVVANRIVNIPDLDAAHVVEVDRDHPDRPASLLWKKDLHIFTAIHNFRHRDGYLYGFTGEIQGEDEQAASDSMLNLVCLELATGKVCWSKSGFKNGVSIIEADGLLFVRSYQTLRLIEATPDGYHVLGEAHTHNNRKPSQELTDFVTPALSRGRLYIRTPEHLICYQVAADGR